MESKEKESTKVTKIGPYLLLKQIGKGAHSEVYKAQKQFQNKHYAIKKISIKNLNQTKKERLQQQINILSSIHNQHIIQYYQLKKSANNFYLIFQYCQNSDLEKYIKEYYNGRVTEQYAREIFLQLSKGFKVLRQKKIVHRDLKLANILVDKQFKIKIADFGFAKNFQNNLMKSMLGTPIAMAPQILDKKKYNETCDIWSMGVILYQILVGKYPFYPDKNNKDVLKSLRQKIEQGKIVFPQQIGLSDQVKNMIRSMLTRQQDRMGFQQFLNHKWIVAHQSQEKSLRCQMRNLVIEKCIKKNINQSYNFTSNTFLLEKKPPKIDPCQMVAILDSILITKFFLALTLYFQSKIHSAIKSAKIIINSQQDKRFKLWSLLLLASNLHDLKNKSLIANFKSKKLKIKCFNYLADHLGKASELSKGTIKLVLKTLKQIKQEIQKYRNDSALQFTTNVPVLKLFVQFITEEQIVNQKVVPILKNCLPSAQQIQIKIDSNQLSRQVVDLLGQNIEQKRMQEMQNFFEQKINNGLIRFKQDIFKVYVNQKREGINKSVYDILCQNQKLHNLIKIKN